MPDSSTTRMKLDSTIPVHAVLYRPTHFSRRSGLYPLVEALSANPVTHDLQWEKLSRRSWTLGHWVQRMGQRYFGSEWNGFFPILDEWKISRRVRSKGASIVHFLFAEYGYPRTRGLFGRENQVVIGTFHVSQRRQEAVIGAIPSFSMFDYITLVSESQVPFFLDHGVPADRLRVILHGVDRDHFCPDPNRACDAEGPLQCLIVGDTERDHHFLAELMRALPPSLVCLEVKTARSNHHFYADIPGVELLPFLEDDVLVDAYRRADLFVCPLLDCTANNAILEAMACGTPVMTNRVGGVPEYVPAENSFIFDTKDVEEWAGCLTRLAGARSTLWEMRDGVREWTRGFAWSEIAGQFRELYAEALVDKQADR